MMVIQQSVRTFVAGFIALILSYYFFSIEASWLILAALFLVQLNTIRSILSCGILIACHVMFVHLLIEHFILLGVYLFVVMFLSIYVGLSRSNLFLPVFFLNLIGIVSVGMVTHSAEKYILIGVCVAMGARLILWPSRVKQDVKRLVVSGLLAIDQLQITLFSIYQKRDYIEHHYLYERRLHQERLKFFNVIQQLRVLLPKIPMNQQAFFKQILQHLNALFEAVVAVGSLRYRVSDQAVLEVGENEFRYISKNISVSIRLLIAHMAQSDAVDLNTTDDILEVVQAFEGVYRATLQVMTEDPVVYLVFIRNAEMVCDELRALEGSLKELQKA